MQAEANNFNNTTGYGSVMSNQNYPAARPKSHLDWVGGAGGGTTGGVMGIALAQGNMSVQNVVMGSGVGGGTGGMNFSNVHDQSNYGSMYAGANGQPRGADSFFFMDQVEMYNVKYNPKAQTLSSGLYPESHNQR